MAKIERVTGKIFGENATATGLDPQIGQFGSALAGTYVGTTDISTIQQLPAWGQGFIGAVTTANQFPALPEMTGFGKVLSYQQNYLLQQGIAEWDSGTTYYDGSFCSLNRKLYVSITNDNLNNNPENDTVNWQEFSSGGAGLEIGDIGIASLGIDETQGKRRYLNGQVIIQEQYQVFADKVKSAIVLYPNLACSEADWQATVTLSAFGQCGKFVVDDEAGTIRLPKITGFIQGLNDLASLGGLIEAGLPNITGQFGGFTGVSITGAFSGSNRTDTNSRVNGGTAQWGTIVNLDASLSNSIYGNSDTVQPESIRYPYFIQIATGSETEDNIINEIELNNPFVLLEGKYFETPVYNVSWLQSNQSFTGSSALHPTAYNALLIEQNTTIEVGTTVDNYTKRGLSVKLTSEAYTDFDFVLDTENQTFRCPTRLATTNRYLVEKKEPTSDDPTWYNLYSDGWCEQGGQITTTTDTSGDSVYFLKEFTNTNYTFLASISLTSITNTWSYTIVTGNKSTSNCKIYCGQTNTNSVRSNPVDWRASGYVSETVSEDLTDKLYFYVGETVQNANLINAGRIEEKLVNKADTNASNFTTEGKSLISGLAMPSNRYIDLTLGASGTEYTAPANGWISFGKATTSAGQYVNLKLKDNELNTIVIAQGTNNNLRTWLPVAKGKSFIAQYNAGGSTLVFRFVYAEGEV